MILKKGCKYLIEGDHPILRRVDEYVENYEDRDKLISQLEFLDYEISVRKITCFDCPDSDTCKVAWDRYNLDGECLNK